VNLYVAKGDRRNRATPRGEVGKHLAGLCFYDQAHFINDFKFFSGFTPEEYLRRKNDILNYVPVG